MMFISAPAEMAQVDHVSVDRLVAALVNEGVSGIARGSVPSMQPKAERGSRENLKRVLSKVRDVPADVRDRGAPGFGGNPGT